MLGFAHAQFFHINITFVLFKDEGLVIFSYVLDKINFPHVFFLAMSTGESSVIMDTIDMPPLTRFIFVAIIALTTEEFKVIHDYFGYLSTMTKFL